MKIKRTLATVLVLGLGGLVGVAIEKTVQAQSAPPAYYVAEVKAADADAMKAHREKVAEVVKQHGGRFMVQGGKVEALAGQAPDGMVAIIQFKSLADAHKWRDSPEIKAIVGSALKPGGGGPRVFLVEGTPN